MFIKFIAIICAVKESYAYFIYVLLSLLRCFLTRVQERTVPCGLFLRTPLSSYILFLWNKNVSVTLYSEIELIIAAFSFSGWLDATQSKSLAQKLPSKPWQYIRQVECCGAISSTECSVWGNSSALTWWSRFFFVRGYSGTSISCWSCTLFRQEGLFNDKLSFFVFLIVLVSLHLQKKKNQIINFPFSQDYMRKSKRFHWFIDNVRGLYDKSAICHLI